MTAPTWRNRRTGRFYGKQRWLAALAVMAIDLTGCRQPPVEISATVYKGSKAYASCEANSRSGKTGISDDETATRDLRYNLRTPSNYDNRIAHPLIIVYPPAGRSGFSTERMTDLTFAATQAGFIIAYPNHKRLSSKTLQTYSKLPEKISEKWCIDQDKIYYTGHSDGGSVAMGLAFLDETREIAKAIAPSAAGIRGQDLERYQCPEPVSVMIMHSREDDLFPGFGQESARWWAACNQCGNTPLPTETEGCQAYPSCAQETKTWYCEGNKNHADWPGLNPAILKFFGAEIASEPTSRERPL